jgi:alpha-D-ribose 1-methylphosphonate 5-triphosphate diphosphatase
MRQQVLTNARIVTPRDHFLGTVVVVDGRISDIDAGPTQVNGVDLQGRWLIPGGVDIHTDQLEREIAPRPNAIFPLLHAMQSLDMRAVSCGLTTILSCLRFSNDEEKRDSGDPIELSTAFERIARHTMAHHYIQARWDTNFDNCEPLLEKMAQLKRLKAIVFNENIPGTRQFRDMEFIYKRTAHRKNISLQEAREQVEEKIRHNSAINNRALVQHAFASHCVIGSHDDTTLSHVDEAYRYGATIAEMPTTIEAARHARGKGMAVCMGASNYVRGNSSYQNLSCETAMDEGLVDMLCSDYHFPTLMDAFAKMVERGINPSEAVEKISLNAARCLKMDEEIGSIEIGKRADLVALSIHASWACVENVWINGNEVLSRKHASIVNAQPACVMAL